MSPQNQLFFNNKYVTNIREADTALKIMKNRRPLISTKVCNMPNLGEVWYNNNSMTNIDSLAHMARGLYWVTMDSKKELVLIMHLLYKTIKFKQIQWGLYAYNPTSAKGTAKNNTIQLFNALQDNLNMISPRQKA